MRIKPEIDLIASVAINLLLIPAVIFSPSNIPRIILGLPFILFLPGYALVAALFPAKSRLSGVERVAYSIALSIALVALIGLLLNYVWSISLYPMLTSLTVFNLAMCAIAWYRRHGLPEEERRIISLKWHIPWSKLAPVDKLLAVLLVLALLGAVGASIQTYISSLKGYTEFYLLGPSGKAEGYPQKLSVGQEGGLTLVLVNRERTDVTYRIKVMPEDCRVWIDGKEQYEIGVPLKNEENRSFEVRFVFDRPGDGKKLEFDLFKEDSQELYLRTYIKVNVD